MARPARMVALAAVLVLAALACGEPEARVYVPRSEDIEPVTDEAGVLDDERVADALVDLEPLEVAAITLEDEEANLGFADRVGKQLIEEQRLDVVLVAVAQPGDFEATEEPRTRVFGVVPGPDVDVPGSLRERIVEELVREPAAQNDWTAAFLVAIEALSEVEPPEGRDEDAAPEPMEEEVE